MNVLVISTRQQRWQALAPEFHARGLALLFSDSLDKALGSLRENPPAVVILDLEPQHEPEYRDVQIHNIRNNLTSILMVNAMVHTAVVSRLSHDEFHDALEGFGVLLGIPPEPAPQDVARLSEALQ